MPWLGVGVDVTIAVGLLEIVLDGNSGTRREAPGRTCVR